ncbi:bifunctional chorismate-binding protein/class IV aminotransferase [Polynucleobacter antarcticus]|uniref:Bifunctional aminodeoxychorismate synthase component I/aminodeoxychorismate lyase n=1 Tax=Polynucleobacter antarcticus TaxID=1743162 RepID=A0A6M9PSP9_9BURK|nr:bifunctional anthranilate synthase component I family protein/class IV aminotransferase [Polynucleobacter antarcticus]QKM62488.1 bifunctional aminodeoxychorismate synthase component I/aminodeoxychorismate lyase [Polynucleobacter antarcticus]
MILLDDAHSTAAQPSSRLYRQALRRWYISSDASLEETNAAIEVCLQEIDTALARGEYIVTAFAYELGRYIHKLPNPRHPEATSNQHPLIQAWAFSAYEQLSKEQVDQFLAQELEALPKESQLAGIANMHPSIDEVQFTEDIKAIQEYIRNGDTYQINHTYRITGDTYGSPIALYARLRDRQPGRFAAYIEAEPGFILSQSPELFIQRNGNTLKAMPMKGTADALSQSPETLSQDSKNQAENVMIVDLLRNDLSRLALPGSVIVPKLFEVARHGDVLQMTSTIEAQAKPKLTLKELLNAVFPCGSVTGAPKKRSMEIIQSLEPSDRGYYCGAIGWLDPSGDFAFSVPIRTVEIEDHINHASTFTLGIGAGITIDSKPEQEWDECRVKAAFLCNLLSDVGVFETILVKASAPQHVSLHMVRLEKSAQALGIPFSSSNTKNYIEDACNACIASTPNKQYRLRIDLAPDGKLTHQLTALNPITDPVKIFWASEILKGANAGLMHSGNILLGHKVTSRDAYDQGWKAAEILGGFDALFINEQGFVTEGGRSSIFIKSKDGNQWLTPPISAGILPGIMRSIVLNDPKWNAHEANLTITEVNEAKEIMLCSALRGILPASF